MFTGTLAYWSKAGDDTVKNVATKTVFLTKVLVRNTTASDCYVQLFNKLAADVTLGTTAPLISIPVIASGFADIDWDENAIIFKGALSFAVTTTMDGSTAPATDATVNIFYR